MGGKPQAHQESGRFEHRDDRPDHHPEQRHPERLDYQRRQEQLTDPAYRRDDPAKAWTGVARPRAMGTSI